MLVPVLLLLAVYAVILFLTARRSIWAAVALQAVILVALILCNIFMVGYGGGSDAMGNGMEQGFLAIFYYSLMILSSLVFGACLLWWYLRIYPKTQRSDKDSL